MIFDPETGRRNGAPPLMNQLIHTREFGRSYFVCERVEPDGSRVLILRPAKVTHTPIEFDRQSARELYEAFGEYLAKDDAQAGWRERLEGC